jgi:phage-related protein
MDLKPIQWLPSTKETLLDLPEDVKDEIGFSLFQAQQGKKSDRAKPLKGFKISSRLYGKVYRGDLRFACFQKEI